MWTAAMQAWPSMDMEMDYAGVRVARSVAGVAQLARASSGSVVQL